MRSRRLQKTDVERKRHSREMKVCRRKTCQMVTEEERESTKGADRCWESTDIRTEKVNAAAIGAEVKVRRCPGKVCVSAVKFSHEEENGFCEIQMGSMISRWEWEIRHHRQLVKLVTV